MLRYSALVFLIAFLFPLALHAAWWLLSEPNLAWNEVDWSSAELLPLPSAKRDALVHVYAARTGRWKGIFAHHSWIVVKERGAASYTRFDMVAWGRPVKVNNWAPDARWYGHPPLLVGAIEGQSAEPLVAGIRAAVARYPYNRSGAYAAWPGPNSNSFVAYVLEQQGIGIALPPTAVGKDWRAPGSFLGPTPSHTGIQLSALGLIGLTIGWVEGIEINVLGLVAGIDVRRPALKIPGFGRIGLDATARASLALRGALG